MMRSLLTSFRLAHPAKTMASSNSFLSNCSILSTPFCPSIASPYMTGRPSSTASAPNAKACIVCYQQINQYYDVLRPTGNPSKDNFVIIMMRRHHRHICCRQEHEGAEYTSNMYLLCCYMFPACYCLTAMCTPVIDKLKTCNMLPQLCIISA